MTTRNFTPAGNPIQRDELVDENVRLDQASPPLGNYGEENDRDGQMAPPPPTQSITPDRGYDDSFDEAPPDQSPDYTPESLTSLGDEPPEYSPSWRWDLRKIKIFKTDNTVSPIDPFTLFYRTRNQKINKDVGNFGYDINKRIIINPGPLLPQQEFSDVAKLAVLQHPVPGGPRHHRSEWVTYFNWSYNGYIDPSGQGTLSYRPLQPRPTDPNLPKIWSDSYLGYDSPKEQSPGPQDIGDSSLFYSSDLPDPFKNPNGLNMPQRIRSLSVSSSLQRMDSVQESPMLAAVSAVKNPDDSFGLTEGAVRMRNQLSVAGYVPPEGQDSLKAFAEESFDTAGQRVVTAEAIQRILDSDPSYSKERADAAAFSVYSMDAEEFVRHSSYQKYSICQRCICPRGCPYSWT
jgi:hypothetical protein